MRLKSFYAKTMTEAMQMVRETLGEDAIIVATREEQGGKAVRVTAAVEPGFHAGGQMDDRRAPSFEVGQPPLEEEPIDESGWLQYDSEDEESAVTEEITDAMLRHGVSEDVMDQIISCATVIGFEQPGVALVAALEHLFHFKPLPTESTNKALMMMGPPGAGKTLAAAKLAARGVMNGLNIGVITCDTVRAGGAEQLEAFTKLLGIHLHRAESADDLREMVNDMLEVNDQVIIDMPGLNPFSREDIKTAARMIGAAPINPVLVLPAGLDPDECGDMGRAFASIGAQSVLGTRVDIARRLGGLLSAVHYGGLSFTDSSNTPKVADGLMTMTPKALAKLLMPAAYQNSSQSAQGRSSSASHTQRDQAASPYQPTTRTRIKS